MLQTNRIPCIAVNLCLFLALLLTSCGPEDETQKRAEVAPATIHWITWDRSSPAEQILIKQFQEQYPSMEFKRDEFNYRWEELLKETPSPDLLNMDVGNGLDAMIRQNQAADLTELWEQTGLLKQVPTTLQKLSEHNGKQYYLPFGFGWVGIYYNKQVFAKYNLQEPQTWEEFIQVCETLRANGETPLSISGNEPWSSYEWFEYLNLRLNGPEFHRGLLTGKERFDDARVRTVLETWKSLFDNGYFIENPQLMGSLSALTALVRGEKVVQLTREKAVMALSDAYNISQLPAPFQAELDFFRFPIMDPALPKAEAINAFGYVIPVGAEHIPQTLAFLSHLSTPAAQAIVAQAGLFSSVTYAPARMDVDPARLRVDQRKALEMLQATDETVPLMWLALPDTMWGMMTYSFDRFVRDQEVDVMIQKFEEARQMAEKKGLFVQE